MLKTLARCWLSLALAAGMLAAPGCSEEVPVQKDVPYCSGGGQTLTMDIYPPRRGPQAAPVVIFIHGGGWRAGSKSDGWGGTWAKRGYLFASIDYRLAPRHPFPAMIEDAKCAVRYLRAHARDYGIDPNRIAVWGNSAGGHLAALLGLTGPEAGFEGKGGWAGVSSEVQAVVDMYGPADLRLKQTTEGMQEAVLATFGADPEMLRRGSPVSWMRANAPPFLILHGRQDNVVPLIHSQTLHRHLRSHGVASELVIVEDAGHEFTETSRPNVDEIDQIIMEFLDREFRHRPEGQD